MAKFGFKMPKISNKMMTIGALVVVGVLIVMFIPRVFEGFGSGDSTLENNVAQFTMFKADWCGFCKKALPQVEALRSDLESRKINNYTVKLRIVDVDKEKDYASGFGIDKYPTYLLLTKDLNIEYTENVDLSKITAFLEANL